MSNFGDLSPDNTILGGTDGATIGNIGDKLKVIDEDSNTTLTAIATTLGALGVSIFKQNKIAITTRVESDLASTTYTVPTVKKFKITSIAAMYDGGNTMYIRFKKQTAGVGSFVTLFELGITANGQGNPSVSMPIPSIDVGVAGDVFKLSYESSLSRGSLWAEYSGIEY